MRWLRLAAPAVTLALWLVASTAQQDAPPAGTPPPSTPSAGTPPARTPPATPTPQASTPQPAATPDAEKDDAQKPADDADETDFIPTEELQPDAAVTFPVDI
jgi:hypothetical protein